MNRAVRLSVPSVRALSGLPAHLPPHPHPFHAAPGGEMPGEECGVVLVFNHPEAAKLAYLGLYALQHRGQEAAGITAVDSDGRLRTHKAAGLVSDIFTPDVLRGLPGSSAIGHVRYSTTGSSVAANGHPIVANFRGTDLAVAHNGNLTNARELRAELEDTGSIFQSTTDTECLIHLIAKAGGAADFDAALHGSLARLRGAYCFVMARPDRLVAARDPHGFRPLVLGKLGEGYVVASESCALDLLDAQFLREVAPGEVLTFQGEFVRTAKPLPTVEPAYCVFENIYFSRPDSLANGDPGRSLSQVRNRLGELLAEEHPADGADVVIAVPDSSVPAAMGYARASGIPFDIGLVRSHYVGRTFIEPDQKRRDFGARLKYNPVRGVLHGRRVVVVDDSIVRGTTSRKIVTMVREAGAREVHFRVSAPVWKNPCYFGIDTPERSKLLGAVAADVDEIRRFIEADSLGFISPEGLLNTMPRTVGYCTACFTGRYPEGQRPAGRDVPLPPDSPVPGH